MVKAYPTDEKGNRNGDIRSFSDIKWATLNRLGKHRWVECNDEKPRIAIELLTHEKEEEVKLQEEAIEDNSFTKRKRVTKNRNNEQ
jgi:hypothetical protein